MRRGIESKDESHTSTESTLTWIGAKKERLVPLIKAEDAVGLEQTDNAHSWPTRDIEAKAEHHTSTELLW